MGLIFLAASAFFLILGDKPLAELAAVFAYIFLVTTVLTQIKILTIKRKRRKGIRLSLASLKPINPKRLTVIILIILTLVLFQKILANKEQIEAGDLSFSIEAKRVAGNLWYLWDDYAGMGANLSSNTFPFTSLNALFTHLLRFSASLSVKIIFLEILALGLFSSYSLAKKILKNFTKKETDLELASLLAVIFYIFNPYSLQRIFHLYHWIAYLSLPLILLLFIKLIETKKARWALILGFVLSFISFSPHYLVYAFIILGLFGIIKTINSLWKNRLKKFNYRNLLKNSFNVFLLLLCFVLFSSHWLIPYLRTSFVENTPQAPIYMFTKEYIKRPKEKFKPIMETLTLQGQETKSKNLNLLFKIFVFILPLVLLIPLLPSLRNKYTVFLSILGLFAAIVSTMPIWHYILYQKMLFDIPYLDNFGWLFRETFRINGLLAFSYSFLLGFLLLRFLRIRAKKGTKSLNH